MDVNFGDELKRSGRCRRSKGGKGVLVVSDNRDRYPRLEVL